MLRSLCLSLLVGGLLVACGSSPSTPTPPTPTPPTPTPPTPTPPTPPGQNVPARDYAVKVPFPALQGNEAQVGQWSNVVDWPVLAIHAALLPSGKVLAFGGNYYPNFKKGDLYTNEIDTWDPATNAHEAGPFKTLNKSLFCGGHVLLADGRLMVAGGDDLTNVDQTPNDPYSANEGIRDVYVYDYTKKEWSAAPPMQDARWYPTTTLLPSGEVLALSGNLKVNVYSQLPEVYNPTTNTWRGLEGAKTETELYPRLFVLSDGRVLNAGGGNRSVQVQRGTKPDDRFSTGILNTQGDGQWSPFVRDAVRRDYASAVMYDQDKILFTGGGGSWEFNNTPPSAAATLIDAKKIGPDGTGGTSLADPMPLGGRRHHNATLLPDGTVLVTGGTSALGFTPLTYNPNDPQVLSGKVQAGADATRKEALLWNPAGAGGKQWSILASNSVPRIYHSVALLLPDATVLVSGGGVCGTGCPASYDTYKNAQVFKPPYLFRGPRPSITSVPNTVGYGQSFDVHTNDAANVAKVNWIRLGSVTHAFDMGQRINTLEVLKRADGTVTVRAPVSANLAPPGHYMLFLLNDQGVPSVARIVHIQ